MRPVLFGGRGAFVFPACVLVGVDGTSLRNLFLGRNSNQDTAGADVIPIAQHPRYHYVDWTMAERLERRQELVLQHIGIWADDGS